jgi:hypothetical protein
MSILTGARLAAATLLISAPMLTGAAAQSAGAVDINGLLEKVFKPSKAAAEPQQAGAADIESKAAEPRRKRSARSTRARTRIAVRSKRARTIARATAKPQVEVADEPTAHRPVRTAEAVASDTGPSVHVAGFADRFSGPPAGTVEPEEANRTDTAGYLQWGGASEPSRAVETTGVGTGLAMDAIPAADAAAVGDGPAPATAWAAVAATGRQAPQGLGAATIVAILAGTALAAGGAARLLIR